MDASVNCPNCRTANPAGAAQCRACGAPLMAPSTAVTAPDLPPVPSTNMATTLVESRSAAVLQARRAALLLSSGYYTDLGRERKSNEDSLLVVEMDRVNLSAANPLGLYVVADGMGGQAAGEVASGLVVSTIARAAHDDLFAKYLSGVLTESYIGSWMKSAIAVANNAVLSRRAADHNNMGSTLLMVVVFGSAAYLAHAGDSRAYYLPSDGELERVTGDHSLVEQLVRSGQITVAEARTHPKRSVIYRTMGEKEDVEADTRTLELAPGDRLVLCSDGLNGMLEDDQIVAIIRAAASPVQATRQLVAAANAAGGRDNITAIVVDTSSL